MYRKECHFGEGTVTDTSEDADGRTNLSEMDISCETVPEETIQSVKITDSEDLLKAIYKFEDVVLPLPGSETLFPGNEVAGIYHEITKKDGISLTESIHGVKEFSITSMKGGYRRVIQRPIDLEWDLVTYTDDKTPLVETDLDVLSKAESLKANEPLSTGVFSCTSQEDSLHTSGATSLVETKSIGSSDLLPDLLAVKLDFTLPASSYATMAIRELMKTSTSVDHQNSEYIKLLKLQQHASFVNLTS